MVLLFLFIVIIIMFIVVALLFIIMIISNSRIALPSKATEQVRLCPSAAIGHSGLEKVGALQMAGATVLNFGACLVGTLGARVEKTMALAAEKMVPEMAPW